jgi:hypothetical protein
MRSGTDDKFCQRGNLPLEMVGNGDVLRQRITKENLNCFLDAIPNNLRLLIHSDRDHLCARLFLQSFGYQLELGPSVAAAHPAGAVQANLRGMLSP